MPNHPALTARQVIDALHGRHPHEGGGMGPGRWTCVEELFNIDLLAFDAWSEGRLVAYEVKVSRSDMRQELLKPAKRAAAVQMSTEFYFAVPAGMLQPHELEYQEPEWDPEDFARTPCPGIPIAGRTADRQDGRPFMRDRLYGGQCAPRRHAPYTTHNDDGTEIPTGHVVSLPVPRVFKPLPWQTGSAAYETMRQMETMGSRYAKCPRCQGKGYLEKSRVEQEAPILWIPEDCGLVVVYETGVTRMLKQAPKRKLTSSPFNRDDRLGAETKARLERSTLGQIVRWVSQRPDPRH